MSVMSTIKRKEVSNGDWWVSTTHSWNSSKLWLMLMVHYSWLFFFLYGHQGILCELMLSLMNGGVSRFLFSLYLDTLRTGRSIRHIITQTQTHTHLRTPASKSNAHAANCYRGRVTRFAAPLIRLAGSAFNKRRRSVNKVYLINWLPLRHPPQACV